MAEFFKQDDTVRFFETAVDVPLADGSVVAAKKEEDSEWLDSNMSKGEVKAAIEAARVGSITTKELAPVGAESLLREQLGEDSSIEEVANSALKISELEKALRDAEAISAMDWANIDDPFIPAALFKTEHRREAVSNRLMNLLQEYTPETTFGSIAEFIDGMGYNAYTGILNIPTGITGGGSRHEQLTKEWAQAFVTLDDEEFKEFVEDRLSGIVDPSFMIAQEPSYLVIEELRAIEAAGADLWGKGTGVAEAMFSTLDLWAVGDAAVSAFKVGRSIVGRLSKAGTKVSTDAALGTSLVVRGGTEVVVADVAKVVDGELIGPPTLIGKSKFKISDDVVDAEVLDDIVPAAVRTNVRPAGPSVNTGIVASRIKANDFIKRFYNRAVNKSFGTSSLPARAKIWAEKQGNVIADASSTRLINFNVEESIEAGHEVRQAVLQFGRVGNGSAFSSYDDALKAANNIPNARIVDLKTNRIVTKDTGSKQFAIEARIGVSPRDISKGIQLDDIVDRTWFGRWFGRANFGSDDTLSSIADQGVAGFKGFERDIQKEIKSIRSLAGKDLETVDTIMRVLRDTPTPNNGALSWRSTASFVSEFKRLRGELPSKEVVKAYEDLVQLSDFSWWISASERLSSLYNQGASVVKVLAEDVIGVPKSMLSKNSLKEKGITAVWDASKQQVIRINDVSDKARVMVLAHSVKVGNRRIQYAVNFTGNSRVPTLVDAFPYNPGGPRSNREIKRFIGDPDGGSWATLIGARSEKDAEKAVSEYNRVAQALAKVTDEKKGLTGLTRAQLRDLTRIVKENRSWHPGITTIEEWVKFARDRGVSITKNVVHRGRGEKIANTIFSGDDFIVNLNLDQYISYHRHDLALREFGGELASNIDPVAAVTHQFTNAASRGAMMRYRIEHPSAWVKAVMKGVDEGRIVNLDVNTAMTDEAKVRNWVIEGSTSFHRKLRQEQSVINRRLHSYDGSKASNPLNTVYTGTDRMMSYVGEIYWDLGPGKTKIGEVLGSGVAELFKGTTYLTLGFFTKMADASQFIMQASHAGAIASMSPKNGFKGTFIASAIRQIARDDSAELFSALEPALKKIAGVDDDVWKAFKEHIFYSGRGYMRGALSEDPAATTLAVSKWDRVKQVASTPFYAGENYSQTVSRVTAFFDVLDSGKYALGSDEFWNAVVKLDRTYSFGLNKAQASAAQTDRIARVGTQWSSYQLSALEHIVSPNSPLSVSQRASLGAYVTLLWGVAGTGVYELFPGLEKEVEEPPAGWLLSHGLDTLFESTLGIRPGERISIKPLQIIDRVTSMYSKSFWENAPAGAIAVGMGKDTASILWYLAHGNESMAAMGAERLARTWKVVDNSVMAYNMLMEDVRKNRTGTTTLEADFSTSEILFQAVGITPAQALDLSRQKSVYFDIKKRKAKALDQISESMALVKRAHSEGNDEVVKDQMVFIGNILQGYGFTPMVRSEVLKDAFKRAGNDDMSYILIELFKNEALNTEKGNF